MAEPARHLALVDPESGEISPEAPSYPDALSLVAQLDQQVRMMERDLAGKRLRIATLEADREQAVLDSPHRAHVELIHALWKRACKRRRPLHYADRERIEVAVKKLGLGTCLAAVAGAAYDPNHSKPRRNGRRDRFDDIELIFREFAQVEAFANRVPSGWIPDPQRISEIAQVDLERVNEWLGASE